MVIADFDMDDSKDEVSNEEATTEAENGDGAEMENDTEEPAESIMNESDVYEVSGLDGGEAVAAEASESAPPPKEGVPGAESEKGQRQGRWMKIGIGLLRALFHSSDPLPDLLGMPRIKYNITLASIARQVETRVSSWSSSYQPPLRGHLHTEAEHLLGV